MDIFQKTKHEFFIENANTFKRQTKINLYVNYNITNHTDNAIIAQLLRLKGNKNFNIN